MKVLDGTVEYYGKALYDISTNVKICNMSEDEVFEAIRLPIPNRNPDNFNKIMNEAMMIHSRETQK